MNAPLSFIKANDKRWKGCSQVIEVVSQSFDPDRSLIGSSPYRGDMGAPGVVVPAAGSTPSTRYLMRLCGVEIPSGSSVILKGIRQAATLRGSVQIEPPTEVDPPVIRVFELEQTSPFWSFPDGNISWHVRWRPGRMSPRRFDAAQLPGQSPQLNGLDAVLTYLTAPPAYTPLAGGIPPGRSVAHLGTLRDLRYPWGQTDWTLNEPIAGPGDLTFWASVYQPPDEGSETPRINIPGCISTSVLRPEDQFLAAFPFARYGRVAGAMTIEMLPCCREAKR